MTALPRLTRLGFALLALSSLSVGAWATLSPRGFYDDFPGGGRHWVSVDGPYNEHLMRDFGGLQLALGVLAAVAAWKLGIVLVRTAAVAYLAFGIPHLIYHATHLDPLPTAGDKVANVVSLSLAVTIPALILLATWWPEVRHSERAPGDGASRAAPARLARRP